jgi:protein arginine N-methyltransferase 1
MIENYVRLLAEAPRLEAVDRALRVAVRPGDVVADIGTGTGAFALFAARAGARRVYAVECEAVAAVAREIAAANGAAEVVTIVEADAGSWTPPEPVDVVVFEDIEDVGIGPAVGTLLPRWKTFLRPGGRFVPATITTRAAPAQNAKIHAKTGAWPDDRAYGLDFSPLLQRARHTRSSDWVLEEDLLAAPETVFAHEMGEPLAPSGRADRRFAVRRPGLLHGIVVWFDAVLAPGVVWSNAPSPRPTLWHHAFLQTPDAFEVREGDAIDLRLSYAPWGASAQIWSWDVTVAAGAGAVRHRETRSTFQSLPFSAAQLRNRSLDHTLRPGARAELVREALALFDGTRSTRAIAEEIARRSPDLLPAGEHGARRVLELLLPLAAPE